MPIDPPYRVFIKGMKQSWLAFIIAHDSLTQKNTYFVLDLDKAPDKVYQHVLRLDSEAALAKEIKRRGGFNAQP